MLGIERGLVPIKSEIIFQIFGFNIANSTLLIFVIMFLVIIFSIFISKNTKLKPNSFQVIVEMIYENLMSYIIELMNNHPHAKKVFPVIATILVYFVISNIIALVPGIANITYHNEPMFRAPTSDFNTVIGISFATVLIINIISIKEQGILSYLGEFVKIKEVYQGFRKGIGEGLNSLVEFFVGLLDIIGELAKILSLSFRLFGNIYAGEIIALIILGSFIYVLPAMWTLFSGFIGLLQGIVFASLVAVYYSLSIKPRKKD
ncbi:MAG: F0F1 ATP synthase subunit A [Candidatus Pacebacteria bacterium]|nr:F0F1 ATP synthase subunit A [Candidatus Paceibacterota bacterium]